MPLEQVSNSLNFYAFYVASKQGVTGLTVTCDVYKVDTSGSSTQLITAGSATAVGGGLYTYRLTSANTSGEGEYIAVFKTSSTTPDQQHIPAIWVVNKAGVEYLDAATSTRLPTSSYSSPPSITGLQADVTTILGRTDVATSTRASATDYTSTRAAKIDNLDATVSSRLTPAGITSMQADVTAIKTPVTTNLDASISSRLASSAYTPTTAMSADVATILSRTDVATSTRLSTANYTASVGSGAISYVVTVTQPDGTTPISGCSVWITTDSGGSNTIAGPLYTNTSGNATFFLAAGSYYLWRTIPGWNFTNPTSITVS